MLLNIGTIEKSMNRRHCVKQGIRVQYETFDRADRPRPICRAGNQFFRFSFITNMYYSIFFFNLLFLIFQTVSNSKTSSPKGNDAHLRAIIQRKKKWKHQFFRRLRAANSVVHGRIWPNFKLIQALMYVIITCKYEKDPIKNKREKETTQLFKL